MKVGTRVKIYNPEKYEPCLTGEVRGSGWTINERSDLGTHYIILLDEEFRGYVNGNSSHSNMVPANYISCIIAHTDSVTEIDDRI